MNKNYFHNTIRYLFKDENGNMIFFSQQGISAISIDSISGEYSIKLFPPACSLNSVICHDGKNRIYVADSSGVFYTEYRHDSAFPGKLHLITNEVSVPNHLEGALIPAGDNSLWICNAGVAVLLNLITKSLKYFTLPSGSIRCAVMDKDGDWWFGTNAGIFLVNTDSGIIRHIACSKGEKNGLSSNTVIKIYSHNGLIWVGTSESGVDIFDPHWLVFKTITKNSDNTNSLSAKIVWAVFQDGKRLFVGTSGGLNIYHLRSERFSDYKLLEENIISQVDSHHKIIPVSSASIRAIIKDFDENYWIGTNKGISVLNNKLQEIKNYSTDNSNLTGNSIFHLLCANDSSIWISTYNGLNRFNPETGKIERYLNLIKDVNSIPVNYILNTYEDHSGLLWISSSHGVISFNPRNKKATNYFAEYSNPQSLAYNIVSSCLEDSRENLWVTTLGGGINLFRRDSNHFQIYSMANGLPSNTVYGMVEDKNYGFWVSTNQGICHFSPGQNTFLVYGVNEGLISQEYSQNAFYKNKSGEVFFGSPEGLVIFDPGEVNENKPVGEVVITGISVNYSAIPYYDVTLNREIRLFHKDKTVSFSFVAPDFMNNEQISYSYKLDGFDNDWAMVNSGQRNATYTNLPFGDFRFLVRIKKNSSNWFEPGLDIKVAVIAPFWKLNWFIFIELFLFSAVLMLIVKYLSQRKLRKKLRQIELQQQIKNERERISRDLHDNVGSHLTYIVSTLDSISNKMGKGEKYIPGEKIAALSEFSRETIQQLRESIWAINKDTIRLSEFKDRVNEYLMKVRNLSGLVSANINLDCEYNSELKPSVAIHLFRIVQESLTNSVKHAEAKNITVTIIESEGKNLSITISDDGKGISDNITNGNHFGMENMEGRVMEIGGTLTVSSERNKGTSILISLKL